MEEQKEKATEEMAAKKANVQAIKECYDIITDIYNSLMVKSHPTPTR